MIIYSLDMRGFYIGSYEKPKGSAIPQRAVTIAPPSTIPSGLTPRWVRGSWELEVKSGHIYIAREAVPIRAITTGAMQSRFTIMEEVAIVDGTDTFSKVLLARLLKR